MSSTRLGQIVRPAIMEKEYPLADAPERRGAKFIRTRRSLRDTVGKAGPHVMHQQIRKEICRHLVEARSEARLCRRH